MNGPFVTLTIFVALLVGCAVFLNSEIVRGGVIAVLLLGAFLVPYPVEHALASAQALGAAPLLRQQDCREVWSRGLSDGHARLGEELHITFLFSSALAILAAVSRRKR